MSPLPSRNRERFALCYNKSAFDIPPIVLVPSPPIRCRQIPKGKSMKNIFVGNLSFGATEDTVRSLFASHGTVERVSIVTDRDTGQARGFGFVEMTDDAEGDRAIAALNGKDLDGRMINVNEAHAKPAGGGGRRSNGGGGGYRGR
jgi:RNA recognition motif-containing protein